MKVNDKAVTLPFVTKAPQTAVITPIRPSTHTISGPTAVRTVNQLPVYIPDQITPPISLQDQDFPPDQVSQVSGSLISYGKSIGCIAPVGLR